MPNDINTRRYYCGCRVIIIIIARGLDFDDTYITRTRRKRPSRPQNRAINPQTRYRRAKSRRDLCESTSSGDIRFARYDTRNARERATLILSVCCDIFVSVNLYNFARLFVRDDRPEISPSCRHWCAVTGSESGINPLKFSLGRCYLMFKILSRLCSNSMWADSKFRKFPSTDFHFQSSSSP